ncbi:MAG: hypothetical protein V3U49_01275 [Nitrososphaerales archaeon]
MAGQSKEKYEYLVLELLRDRLRDESIRARAIRERAINFIQINLIVSTIIIGILALTAGRPDTISAPELDAALVGLPLLLASTAVSLNLTRVKHHKEFDIVAFDERNRNKPLAEQIELVIGTMSGDVQELQRISRHDTVYLMVAHWSLSFAVIIFIIGLFLTLL